jgi:hypothetical protein
VAGERKPRLVRLDPTLDKALEKAALREMKSVNALIATILRREMTRTGDLRDPAEDKDDS